jgi:hypothetical protein
MIFVSETYWTIKCSAEKIVHGLEKQYVFYFSFIHMCIQCLSHFSPLPPPPPTPSLSPPTPLLPGRNYFALISDFVKESISNNRKDQGFLLVEIRIAVQGAVCLSFTSIQCFFNLTVLCLHFYYNKIALIPNSSFFPRV